MCRLERRHGDALSRPAGTAGMLFMQRGRAAASQGGGPGGSGLSARLALRHLGLAPAPPQAASWRRTRPMRSHLCRFGGRKHGGFGRFLGRPSPTHQAAVVGCTTPCLALSQASACRGKRLKAKPALCSPWCSCWSACRSTTLAPCTACAHAFAPIVSLAFVLFPANTSPQFAQFPAHSLAALLYP